MILPNPQDYAIRELFAFVASVLVFIWAKFYAEVFSFFGVHSPIRTREAFKKMARRLLQSMGRLDASRVLLFRTSNGESYMIGNPTSTTKIRAVFSYATDGFSQIPSYEAQDRAFQVLLLLEQSSTSDKVYYTSELKYDFLKSFLFEYDIRAFCVVKILDETKRKLYGFCVYTWSDIHTIPNKSGTDRLKDREYVESLSVYIKEKFIEIIQYSSIERLKRLVKSKRFVR